MAVHPDGRLFISTFEPNQNNNSGQPTTPNGKVWALTNTDGNDPNAVGVTEVANGLFEPAGMTFVNGVLYVSQRLEVTRLLDNNGDGFYETRETVGSGWESDNYHNFHFGLIERNGFTYSTLSTSIIFEYNGLNGPGPANRGTWVRTNLATGQVDYLAGGLRTPNGIGFGPDGDVFQTDNQGSWQPSSRLNHLREGHFYGHYNNTADGGVASLYSDQPVTPAAVYLPQNEISNSPTQPLLIPEGRKFAGDMLVGELTLGGIRRVSLEKVAGEWQGAVYRFTQGLEAGVNRIEWGPDGSLYVGCIGATGNWSWNGTTTGLQRLSPKAGAAGTFEMDRVEATPQGFRIKYTKPVPAATLNNPANFVIRQWTYNPSQDYGGAKVNLSTLQVSSSVASADRKSVDLTIPGLAEGYVIYLKSDLVADSGEAIWSSEAWYTLNNIPPASSWGVSLDSDTVLENEPSGTPVGGLSVSGASQGELVSFSLPSGQLDNSLFAIDGSTLTTAASFDHERRSTYQVRVRATDGSGLFSEVDLTVHVADATGEHPPRRILLTNAVLPPDHVTGALVGRLLMDDEDLGDLQPATGVASESVSAVYESFSYGPGGSQAGQSGGHGFSGAWAVIGMASTIPAGSLSYTDAAGMALASDGNRGFCQPASRNHRPLASARGTDGTVTYASFIADPGSNVHYWGVEFWNGSAVDGNRVLQIGNESGFGARVRNTTNKFFSQSDGSSRFFVVKIEHLTGNDRVSVWIDPTLASEPGHADLSFSQAETGGSITFDRIGFSDFVTTSAPAVDEFRLGDDWSSVTPHHSSFPGFELVTGAGDNNNTSFQIRGDQLFAASVLPAGLHSIRVRVNDSASLSFEQALLVWVGPGHLDSNSDGISDGDAVRLGLDPLAAGAVDAYFGPGGAQAILALDVANDRFLLDAPALPGNLYWLESSPNLAQWTLAPQTLTSPQSFLTSHSSWEIPWPSEVRHFWRVGGGWPNAHGIDPLANGLAGLSFIGGTAGWAYDAASGVLRHDTAVPSSWVHFGQTFDDFLLRLEYRLSSGGNAGIFLRSTESGDPWVTGSEIQITNEPRLPVHSSGAVYDRIAANPAADASHSIWHRMEILMIANRLRVTIDGIVTVDSQDVSEDFPAFHWPQSGLIGLQDSHASVPGTVEYRGVRVIPIQP